MGAGVVGLSIAHRLQQVNPRFSITVLDKEPDVATHQTGHNSGVLHSGIYYKPGSLKARLCLRGNQLWQDFCRRHELPFERCGKVIVAANEAQRHSLMALKQRGEENGIPCRLFEPSQLLEHEPFVTNSIGALHVPGTGIIDYVRCCQQLADSLRSFGAVLKFNTKALSILDRGTSVVVKTAEDDLECDYSINCAGLYADKLARNNGDKSTGMIVPFRGEYYALTPAATHYCRNLIYPVPDPGFPFLGVHLTRMISGGVECGPNAVLAYAREGYSKYRVDWREFSETLAFKGFRRLAMQTWRKGLHELWMSLSKRAFLNELQKLVPAIALDDLVAAPSGVRAQAVDIHGNLVDDFLFHMSHRVLHVLNAPSPAATAAPAIAEHVVSSISIP